MHKTPGFIHRSQECVWCLDRRLRDVAWWHGSARAEMPSHRYRQPSPCCHGDRPKTTLIGTRLRQTVSPSNISGIVAHFIMNFFYPLNKCSHIFAYVIINPCQSWCKFLEFFWSDCELLSFGIFWPLFNCWVKCLDSILEKKIRIGWTFNLSRFNPLIQL